MLEGVRIIFLNQYLSETLQTGAEVFQLTLLMVASFLFFRDRKLEDKVKEWLFEKFSLWKDLIYVYFYNNYFSYSYNVLDK